jgi:hypothetical protein
MFFLSSVGPSFLVGAVVLAELSARQPSANVTAYEGDFATVSGRLLWQALTMSGPQSFRHRV